MHNNWLSPEEIAERYGVPLATIYGWRTKGYGPKGVKIGRHVRYPAVEVARWEQELLEAGSAA
jgi:predicted DNA-binding transcriptional regulator AlpA